MVMPVFMYYGPSLIVVIKALAFDLTDESTGWMEDPDLPEGECFAPALDLEDEKFTFPRNAEGEQAALRKIAELYAAQLAPA